MKWKVWKTIVFIPLLVDLVFGGALFSFQDAGGARFVFQLHDPVKIQHARDLVAGRTISRPHISGKIVKQQAIYNRKYTFHLDPATIDFFELSIEVCDSGIRYVQEHLGEACGAFLPGCHWCPWSSRLVEEIDYGKFFQNSHQLLIPYTFRVLYQ